MLAISNEIVDHTLTEIERVGSWPTQVLNIGLFVLVLGGCWLYLQNARKDLIRLQKASEDDRKEYITSLRTLLSETTRAIERNSTIFDRLERRLPEKHESDKGD